MAEKNNSNLFFTCSLIEFIGRKMLLPRRSAVDALGKEAVERIYDYADIFHCEPIEKVAAEFIEEYKIPATHIIITQVHAVFLPPLSQSI